MLANKIAHIVLVSKHAPGTGALAHLLSLVTQVMEKHHDEVVLYSKVNKVLRGSCIDVDTPDDLVNIMNKLADIPDIREELNKVTGIPSVINQLNKLQRNE